MIKRKSLLFWSAELLIVATLIWVCTKLDFLFHPIIVFISVIFVPLIVSIFFILHDESGLSSVNEDSLRQMADETWDCQHGDRLGTLAADRWQSRSLDSTND